MRVLLDHDRAVLLAGDSADLGSVLAENSIDAIVTDPPAGIKFMSRSWDSNRGGRDHWVDWLARTLAPAFRALKPGGHALVWSIPRTQHWTMLALEDIGFELRDVVFHAFGQGFPKSLTSAAAEIPAWAGTALKPAVEPWILCRKPLDGTVAENIFKWGTGCLNIDGCRIGTVGEVHKAPQSNPANRTHGVDVIDAAWRGDSAEKMRAAQVASTERLASMGRWPAHLVISHSEDCRLVGEEEEERPMLEHTGRDGSVYGAGLEGSRTIGTSTVRRDDACAPGCAAAALDAQSGKLKVGALKDVVTKPYAGPSKGREAARRLPNREASSGGASRLFYCAKPAKSETELGLDHLPRRSGGEATDREDGSAGLNSPRAGANRTGGRANVHPTKKSVALMRYFCRLIAPPGGVVLDPFSGSGATGLAALAEGMRFVGCEEGGGDAEAGTRGEYLPILVGRVRHALGLPPEAPEVTLSNAGLAKRLGA